MMQRHNFGPANQIKKVWKSAQLLIGFHKDRQGRAHKHMRTWSPANGLAGLHSDTSKQETFVSMEAASGRQEDDVLVKLRPDQIVVRRESGQCWQGVIIKDDCIAVRTADGAWIKIEADGAVIRHTERDETVIEADNSVSKRTANVEAMMSSDGIDMARSTSENVAFVVADGVTCRPRDGAENCVFVKAGTATAAPKAE